jgi:hypothetical protein
MGAIHFAFRHILVNLVLDTDRSRPRADPMQRVPCGAWLDNEEQAMWRSGWLWVQAWRRKPLAQRPDAADMGVDFGLEASLHSRLPPLMEMAATGGAPSTGQALPLGTDRRSPPP